MKTAKIIISSRFFIYLVAAGAMAGPFFETFVISEIIKSHYNAGLDLPISLL